VKIAVLTMVKQSYNVLEYWLKHYGAAVGHENLYVISHGNDPHHKTMAQGAQVIGIPEGDMSRFEGQRHAFMSQFITGLTQYYDVVIKTDADEILFCDPDLYSGFGDCFAQHPDADAMFGVGFEVLHMADEAALDWTQLISAQRRVGMTDWMLSKAFATRGRAQLKFHGVAIRADLDALTLQMPKGLYMAHLKYADQDGVRITTREVWGSEYETAGFVYPRHVNRFLKNNKLIESASATQFLNRRRNLMAGDLGKHRKNRNVITPPILDPKSLFEVPERFVGLF